MNRKTRANEEMEESENIINQLPLAAICRWPSGRTHSSICKSTKCVHKTFSKKCHRVGHKARLHKFESMFSVHNIMKLDVTKERHLENSQVCGN